MEGIYYSSAAEGSATTLTPGAQSVQAEGLTQGTQNVQAWSRVDLRRTRHLTQRDEYFFTTDKGHQKSTDREHWQECIHKGKKAGYYRYKGVHYYTREKLGS